MDVVEAYRLLIAEVYELAGASRRTSEELAATAGQTTARWHLLSVLSDGARTTASAARRLGLARQSVQRVADDLLASGHLRREPNPGHARAPLLAVTPAGAEALEAVVQASDADRRLLLQRAGVEADELLAVRDVLRRLADALGETRDS